jgi:formylglycine-generating enzyme
VAAGAGGAPGDTGGAPSEDTGGAPDNGGDGPSAGAAGESGGELDDTTLSCASLSRTACHGESCCKSALVPGCDACAFPSGLALSVADFRLDKYEVTVGRFREFVKAYSGPPKAAAGAHTKIAGSGWQTAWNANIAANASELKSDLEQRPCKAFEVRLWSKTPGTSELKPMNCLTWYEAFAFCAWDGGFLPSELEWHVAATGAEEERKYPWGESLDTDHALYGACGNGVSATCDESSILEVGSKPAGAGRWGQLDLAGSVWEWLLDTTSGSFPAATPCNDCANLSADGGHRIAGGSWVEDASYLPAAARLGDPAESVWDNVGIRCARAP